MNKVKGLFSRVASAAKRSLSNAKEVAKELSGCPALGKRAEMLCMMLLVAGVAMAQSAGDYSAGTNALEQVSEEIIKYVPIVVKLCYAIAGVVAVVGAISVYIAMNNDEQDVKKKIMMVVGACLFLIAAAQALPLFFGISV